MDDILVVDNPCRYCTYETGRKAGCHSECSLYAKYKEQQEALNERIRADKKYRHEYGEMRNLAYCRRRSIQYVKG